MSYNFLASPSEALELVSIRITLNSLHLLSTLQLTEGKVRDLIEGDVMLSLMVPEYVGRKRVKVRHSSDHSWLDDGLQADVMQIISDAAERMDCSQQDPDDEAATGKKRHIHHPLNIFL